MGAVSAGEVSAKLRFDVEKKALQEALADLTRMQDEFKAVGGAATTAGQQIQQAMITAQKNIETLQGQVKKTETEMNNLTGNTSKGMKKVSEDTQDAEEKMSQLDRVALRMAQRLAILFALRETFQFIQSVYEGAEALLAMNRQLDVSIEKLYAWQHAGEQVAIPTEKLSTAITTLFKNLSQFKGIDALQDIGLNFEKIFSLNPEQRLDAIAKGIESINSPSERLRLEVALFGTDAIDPLIRRYSDAMRAEMELNKVHEDSIRVVAQAGESYRNLFVSLKDIGTDALSTSIQGFANLFTYEQAVFLALRGDVQGAKELLGQFNDVIDITGKSINRLPTDKPLMGQAFIDSLRVETQLTDEMRDKMQQLADINQLTEANAARAADATSAQFRMFQKILQDRAELMRGVTQEHKQQVELEFKQQETLRQAYDDYYKSVIADDNNALAVKLANIDFETDKKISALTKQKMMTTALHDIIIKQSEEQKSKVISDMLEQDKYTREHYEKIRDVAREAYFFALFHASSYTQQEIQMRHDAWRQAEQDLSHWRDAAMDAMDKTDEKTKRSGEQVDEFAGKWSNLSSIIKDTAGSVITYWGEVIRTGDAVLDQFGNISTKTREIARTLGGSTEVTALNFDQVLGDYVKGISGGGAMGLNIEHFGSGEIAEAQRLASMGYSFEEIIYILTHPRNDNKPLPPPAGPRIPGFLGGVENFEGGLAYVHRDETLVNLSKGTSVIPAGGGGAAAGGSVILHAGAVQILYPIMNDARAKDELARLVGDSLIVRMRNMGYIVAPRPGGA